MKESDNIIVENLASLIEQMNNSEFWVEWKVLSNIGPDWIGSSRSICFYLGELAICENKFHDQLRSAMIEVAKIPETSSETVIDGEGKIQYLDGKLNVKYWWSKAIPYQDPCEQGNSEGTLVIV